MSTVKLHEKAHFSQFKKKLTSEFFCGKPTHLLKIRRILSILPIAVMGKVRYNGRYSNSRTAERAVLGENSWESYFFVDFLALSVKI